MHNIQAYKDGDWLALTPALMLPSDTTKRARDLLAITVPVVQAPCSWATSSELAAAVSDSGGLGTLGPSAGRTTAMRNLDEARELLCGEVRKLCTLTARPFGVNFIVPPRAGAVEYMATWPRIAADVIVQGKVPVALFVNGYGMDVAHTFLERFRTAGATIVYRDISPTVRKAIAAQQAGAHIYVATGYDSGGLLSRTRVSTMVIVSQVVDALHIPVLAAGGVYNAHAQPLQLTHLVLRASMPVHVFWWRMNVAPARKPSRPSLQSSPKT